MIRKLVFNIRVWVTMAAPFVLLLLPSNFFDGGESICLSKLLLNTNCYACGMTKAVMHFVHFEFSKAWEYNYLSFLVVPLLFPLWIKAFYEYNGKQMPGLLGRLM